MSLKIDSNLEYIFNRLSIPEDKIELYKDKSVEEILQAEAAQGNQEAIKMAADMFTDPSQLIELFQLADPNNKLFIIQSLSTPQLEELIPMLETQDLLEGLRFFNMNALMEMLENIPKEELVKTVFQMFTEEQVIEFMPEGQLDKFLTSFEMDKELVLKCLKNIPETYLQQILESVTGEEANGNQEALVKQISQLGDLDYKNAIKNLHETQKRELTFAITSTDKKFYENFDASAYTKIMSREREKDDIIKSMGVIKPEYLQKMVQNLPKDLLSIVITQIDTEKFADVLINKYTDVLAKLIGG